MRAAKRLRAMFEEVGVYLATVDLESDLIAGPLHGILSTHYGIQDNEGLYQTMTQRKAENMHSFVGAHGDDLALLIDDPICAPLKKLKALVSKPACR